jgi:hypothetical protein
VANFLGEPVELTCINLLENRNLEIFSSYCEKGLDKLKRDRGILVVHTITTTTTHYPAVFHYWASKYARKQNTVLKNFLFGSTYFIDIDKIRILENVARTNIQCVRVHIIYLTSKYRRKQMTDRRRASTNESA